MLQSELVSGVWAAGSVASDGTAPNTGHQGLYGCATAGISKISTGLYHIQLADPMVQIDGHIGITPETADRTFRVNSWSSAGLIAVSFLDHSNAAADSDFSFVVTRTQK